MSKRLTITIEDDGNSVLVTLDGGIRGWALLHTAAEIMNHVCEITRVSPEELFAYAEQIRMHTLIRRVGSCVTVPGVRRGANGDD